MRKTHFLMALIFTVLVTGAAFAGEPAPVVPEPGTASQASPGEGLSDELTALLPPKPIYKYGMKTGPCTVSVTCIGPYQISCSGQTVCYWKGDSISNRGFVECDGRRTTCAFEP